MTPDPVVDDNPFTEAALLRRFVYDVAPCDMAREVAAKVGLPGVSEEGHDAEHDASHDRLALTDPIDEPMAELMTAMLTVFSALVDDTIDFNDVPEPQRKMLKGVFTTLIDRTLASGIPVVLATLIDLGYLAVVRGDFDAPRVISHG